MNDLLKRWAQPVQVLDHGFVKLVDVMGDDGAIVEAARQSTTGARSEHAFEYTEPPELGYWVCHVCGKKAAQKSGQGPCIEGDRRLIRYMYRNGHTSPFEMCEIKLLVKLPIFVARQWIRHRTASVNEMSGRYTVLPDEFYMPQEDRIGGQGKDDKQGTEGNVDDGTAGLFRRWVSDRYEDLRSSYEFATGNGISNELARLCTGVGQYTQWMWKIDLHNLLHFLGLRCEEHAQWEIRQYANVISVMVKDWVPLAWEAWNDYHPKREAHTFSRVEMDRLRAAVSLLGWSETDWDVFLSDVDPADVMPISEQRAFLKALCWKEAKNP